jgi:predicted RNase H-like HicB family nuclease
MTTRKVIIRPGESGFYVVTVPSLPGCISQGKTRQEAIENIKEAIQVYVESLEEDGLPVPADEYETVEVVA